MVAAAIHYSEILEGTFDITFESLHGPLEVRPGLGPAPAQPRQQVKAPAPPRGLSSTSTSTPRRTPSSSTRSGTKVSLGGIAKGYAVGRGAAVLDQAGLDVVLSRRRGATLSREDEARRHRVVGRRARPRGEGGGRATVPCR